MTCKTAHIKYGTVTLNTVPIHSSVSSQPMRADDGIGIKYWKNTVEVEFIATVDPSTLDGNGINSIDNYFDTVKAQLQKPGQAFEFNYMGFGKVAQTTTRDIVYGPYPQVIDWRPVLGNKSIKVIWRVDWASFHCVLNAVTPGSTNPNSFNIIQLSEDSNLSFDQDGAVVIQTNGTLEVAYASNLTRNELREFVAFYFPNELLTFHREVEVSFRKDQRTVDYRVRDTEIKSDNPLFPYMVTQDVTHSISSNLQGDAFQGTGFRTWLNDLNGTFRVRPGEWKGWAVIAFQYILSQRQGRSASGTPQGVNKVLDEWDNPSGDTADDLITEANPEDADNTERDARKDLASYPRQFPVSLKIQEQIYGREVTVNSKWVTMTSLYNLFRSTGMFYPVWNKFVGNSVQQVPKIEDIPRSIKEQWVWWKTYLNASGNLQNNTDGYRGLDLPNYELFFDLCGTNSDQPYYSQIRRGPGDSSGYFEGSEGYLSQAVPDSTGWGDSLYEFDSSERPPLGLHQNTTSGNYANYRNSTYFKNVTPSTSWVHYDANMNVSETTNATYVPTIENYDIQNLAYTNYDTSQRNTQVETRMDKSRRDQVGFRINSESDVNTNQLEWINDIIQIHGKPIYHINFTGYAIRVGYPIPTPALMDVRTYDTAGSQFVLPSFRVGKQGWNHRPIAVSDEVPVFMAQWNLNYAVPRDIKAADIKFMTSGQPAEFA